MAWWIWIILGALLLAAEAIVTADFYLVFFGLAALVLGLLGVFGLTLPGWVQFLLFAAIAVVGLVFFRRRLKQRLQIGETEPGPDLIGACGVARAPIAVGARGRIDLRGAAWDARNDGTTEIPAGGRCLVERVDGLTLHVRAET
jgi:inner membrane protein